MTVSGAYRSSVNMRGVQSATEVDEVVSAIIIGVKGLKNFTFILPDAFTEAQLNALFAAAPTVTGTKVITASGCAGWAALDSGEKAVLTGKGYTLN
jgi:hypothetical protein